MSPGVGKGGKQEGIGDWARTSPEQCRVYPSTLGVLLPKPGTRGQHPTILSIHVLVRLPAHARLSGWSQEESALSGGGAPDKGLAGLACMSELRLVAYAFGRRLTTRAKEQKEQIVELEQGPRPGKFAMEPLAEKLCKVDITVPSDLASSHSTPCPLNLELWEHDSLLGDSCMLLVPASMPSVAAEVRSLPCGCDGNQDVEEFVADLGRWQRSHQHMATAKSAGVPVGKDTLGGWEAGALLTRQAVVRGLPAVATLLVETLMALPHPSPHPFTHLARAHTHISSGAAADDTAALGGLLHLALLSPCSTTMLWTVLDWGRQWSGEGDSSTEGADFAWNWGEQNAAGDTPLRLLEQLPKGAAVLQLLLEDPEQGPSVKAASQHASRGNGTSLTQAGNSSHLAAASTCPDTTTTTKQLLTLSTGVFQRLQGAFSNSLAHALTLHGSNEPEEAEFRGWVRTQSTPLAKLCFLFNVVHLCTLLLRAVLHKQLHTDIPCLAALLVPYAVAAVASNEAPQTAELLVVLVMLGRLCATLLLSFQLVPIPTSFATVLRLRTEALLEVMVINTMEYVRLSWLLLLRMVLLAGYGLFYRLYGLPYPWLQALGVHAASFLVSCAVDARYRYLFAKRRHKEGTQYEAAPLAGPLATPPAEGAAGTAASATTAQGAAMPAGGEVLEAKGQQKKLPADADEQTGAKNALLQAKPQKPLQASLGSAILACMGKVVLEVINLAFTPLPCVLVAVHLVCEVPVYLKAGHTLPMALFKALSFGLLLWAPPCVLLHTNWWRPLQQLKGRVLQAKAALGAEPQHAPSVTSPTSPSAAGATAAASAAANTEGASQQQQAGSVAEGGNGAGGEQDQPNKLVVVPLYKISDFAAVDNTEESVRSQESNVRSQLEHINQMVQQKHVYTSRFRRYKVDLKIPGQVDHSLLPADALPQIVSLLSERDFTQRITGTAVRHGCIIVSLHMCQEMEQQELLSQQQGHGTAAAAAAAAMQQQQQQQQQRGGPPRPS
uniref:Uncharacterized protein n=1 Tax=Dunaliella tertiolecta TaxID=3047 RepID=A0A7S3QNT2_DUNTE